MALIVEDGTGIIDAESLTSVAFADDYHAKRGNAEWAAIATTEIKEQLLRKATDYAVATYAGVWAGIPATNHQSLPFPRIIGGVNVGVPVLIQQGIAELALYSRTTPLMSNQKRGKKKVKIGPLEVEYDGNSSVATLFTSASLRFAPYLNATLGNSFNAKLVRC